MSFGLVCVEEKESSKKKIDSTIQNNSNVFREKDAKRINNISKIFNAQEYRELSKARN